MTLALIVGLSCILLGGFLLLTALEGRRGTRIGEPLRRRLDRQVARVAFIIAHVDWSAFVKHLLRTTFERVAHDVVHGTLLAVRFVERILTRTVRALRERQSGDRGVSGESRQKVAVRETLQKFRKSLAQVQAAQARKAKKNIDS